MRRTAEALSHVEDVVVRAGGAALRYGGFYGPGATDDLVELVRKRRFPLVGGGTGYFNCISNFYSTAIANDVLPFCTGRIICTFHFLLIYVNKSNLPSVKFIPFTNCKFAG